MSTKAEDDRINEIPKYSEFYEKIKPEQISLFDEKTESLGNETNDSSRFQDEIELIEDIFKGKRACSKPDSLMNTQRAEGGEITWTREELYDRKSIY